MTKLTSIAVAMLVAGASTMATANVNSPAPPSYYNDGPNNFLNDETDIDYAERKAMSVQEAEKWMAPFINYDPEK